MANSKSSTEAGAENVTIYVTATVARIFRLAGALKEYQQWPEPGKLGRYYTIHTNEVLRVLEAAELTRDKIHRSDAPKRKGLSCFLVNTRTALDAKARDAAFARFIQTATDPISNLSAELD